MADVATRLAGPGDSGVWRIIRKRWRAWLRAIHRDVGYLAIGFTVIYAISGIAQNHIEDWGEVSYKSYERTLTMRAPADDAPDDVAIKAVVDRVALGTPTSTFRAGDEIRLEYGNGAKVTAIGDNVTIQGRERRAFIGVANWLHTARNKKGWKYAADAFAVLLLYLAISGIFMIKGRLGFKWRGALLISAGVAVPVFAVLTSSRASKAPPDEKPPAGETMMMRQLPPRELPPPPAEPPSAEPPAPAAPPSKCDPFSSMHGCK